jgi:WD40 repeat protein
MDRTVRVWDIRELLRSVQYRDELETARNDPERFKADLGIDADEDPTEWLDEQLALLPHREQRLTEWLRAQEPEVLIQDGYVLWCNVTRDGQWLVTTTGGEETGHTARLWDLSAASSCASPVRISLTAEIDNFYRNQAFALSADHRRLLTLATSSLWELDPDDTATLLPAAMRATWFGAVQIALFSPDGDWLVLSPDKKGLVRCDLRDRSPVPEAKVLPTGDGDTYPGVRWADFSPDGRWFLAECGSDTAGEPSQLRLWDRPGLAGAGAGQVILASSDWLRPRAFSPDGRWFVAFDKVTGHVWDMSRPQSEAGVRTLKGHSDHVVRIDFAPSSRHLVTGGADGKVLLWNLDDGGGAPAAVWAEGGSSVHGLAVDWERHAVLVGRENGSAQLLTRSADTGAMEPAEIPGHAGNVWSLFSPDGRWFATTDSGGIRLFDRARLECRLSIPKRDAKWFSGHMLWFTRNGKWLIVARQAQVFLVPLQGGHSPATVELQGHKYEQITFRLSTDERWLVTGDQWMEAPRGFQPISSCRIWDLWSPNPADSGVALPGLPRGVDRLAITKDDRWLITASPDGVRLWPLGTQHLLELAKRMIGTEMTEEERDRSGIVASYGRGS